MFGFYNRILTIDMSASSSNIEKISDNTLSECLGGKGLATHLLLERNPDGVDPLSPENHLIFATGPFCGGLLWGGSRYGVYTKSPLTGFYAESYSGGRVPEAMDSTGFDAIIFIGQAKKPTVVSIEPEGVTFHDAGDLWGMDSISAEEQAVARFAPNMDGYRKPGAVTIGPAGENLVRFALISNDKWRCAGRIGAGAVMGSKYIKSVVYPQTSSFCPDFENLHTKEGGTEGRHHSSFLSTFGPFSDFTPCAQEKYAIPPTIR